MLRLTLPLLTITLASAGLVYEEQPDNFQSAELYQSALELEQDEMYGRAHEIQALHTTAVSSKSHEEHKPRYKSHEDRSFASHGLSLGKSKGYYPKHYNSHSKDFGSVGAQSIHSSIGHASIGHGSISHGSIGHGFIGHGSHGHRGGYEKTKHVHLDYKMPKILMFESESDRHFHHYGFETENGIKTSESVKTYDKGTQQKGSYSYTGDDGQIYTVHYIADENGFRAEGAHIPTSAPLSEGHIHKREYKPKESSISSEGKHIKHTYHLPSHVGRRHTSASSRGKSSTDYGSKH